MEVFKLVTILMLCVYLSKGGVAGTGVIGFLYWLKVNGKPHSHHRVAIVGYSPTLFNKSSMECFHDLLSQRTFTGPNTKTHTQCSCPLLTKSDPLLPSHLGRAPLIMTRIPGLVYGLSFFGAFVVGAGSYQKTCYKRIMALENSALRDFYQQSVAFAHVLVRCVWYIIKSVSFLRVEKQKKGRNVPERIKRYAEKKSDSPHYSKDETRFHPPSVSKQQSMPKQRPQPSIPSPNVKLEEGPSINMRSYTRDKSMLDTSNQQADQPNAFSSDKPNDTVQPFQYEAPQETTRR